MSQEDVERVFGPQHVQDSLEFYKTSYYEAEKIIIALRKKLSYADPSLPHPLDGRAWAGIERAWKD